MNNILVRFLHLYKKNSENFLLTSEIFQARQHHIYLKECDNISMIFIYTHKQHLNNLSSGEVKNCCIIYLQRMYKKLKKIITSKQKDFTGEINTINNDSLFLS